MSSPTESGEPKVTVVFERKKSDGNYGSGACTIIWSQVPVGADESLIEALARTSEDVTAVVRRLALEGVREKYDPDRT